MSLSNIEGKLTKDEMENVMAGSGFLSSCAGASVGLGLGFISLVAGATSVVGAGIGGACFVYASAQWGAACR
ncbi:hypothetical protein [Flavobacterium anhuiense]|uniref:hypothetical protein n=1 Tax=Flavobacterium anhuiense TaxID=459526 RepID=UPI003D95B7A1